MPEKINTEQLRVGMYVLAVGLGSFNSPTIKVNMLIQKQSEIDALLQSGATDVIIDTDKGDQPSHPFNTETFKKSVGEVNEKMVKAVAYSRSMMEDVRLGKAVDPEAASEVVDSMLNTVFTNESAALFLTKLGNYDDYTYMHCVNVSVLASVFGRHLGLEGQELHDLGLSGLLHDLGKAQVPDEILNKPGKLTPDEFAVMQSHPLKGYNQLNKIGGLSKNILNGALQHHEKWDGTGYPGGIKGPKISDYARIIAVVDIYDAMTSNRIYHKKRAETDVLGFLFKQKQHFAPQYVELFVKAVGIYPPGTLVKLSNGKTALVCAANPENSLMPMLSFVSEDMKVIGECFNLASLSTDDTAINVAEVMDQGPMPLDLAAFMP